MEFPYPAARAAGPEVIHGTNRARLAVVVAALTVGACVNRPDQDRWETRKLLQRFVSGQERGTFVWTPHFPMPRLFYVQAKFASAIDSGGTGPNAFGPALPFQPFPSARLKVTLQRYIDDHGGVLEDVYILNGYNPSQAESAWLPVAIVAARKLVITAEIIDEAPGHVRQFVDIAAALTESIDTAQVLSERYAGSDGFLPNIFGFGDVPETVRVAASAVPVVILPADQTRRQFWITNEGSTRLALRFSINNPSVAAGTESWDVILSAKGGASCSYRSDPDTYWGPVNGVWEGVPTGFAVATGATIL